ncbi:MAG: hypothetical protein ACK46Q_06140 [Hyphomonas sp.]
MSLAYPIARNLEDAVAPGAKVARSLREAAGLSPGFVVTGLETSWLHLPDEEANALFSKLGADGAAGHLQRYEDNSGHAVIAVSWWKLVDPNEARPESKPPPRQAPASADHTDDLYFRRGRTRPRRRKPADPNQLDLFGNTAGE